ncbi:mitochondrial escape protein 2 [Linnemannia zychae]|nr:mitochondrial escape protein 2 [Linnemannia zychae]
MYRAAAAYSSRATALVARQHVLLSSPASTTVRTFITSSTSASTTVPRATRKTPLTRSSVPVQPTPFLRTQKVKGATPRKYTTETPIHAEEELPLQYGMLYFDNAYPLKMGWWDIRYSLLKPGWRSLERKAKTELVPPEHNMPFHFKIGGIEPRLKDGGMFVHFSYVRPSSYTTKEALKEIESRCEQHLISKGHYMWFNFQKVRAFLVKGSPFLEDLASRYPNSRIRVEFSGNLDVEALYTLFRKYGKIVDIVLLPPVKDMPRQAIVQYKFMRASTSAKFCLHGTEVNGTQLYVTYEKTLQGNTIWTWLTNHPKISVPLGGMALAGMSFIIFDPMRVFSMHAKITQLFNLNEYSFLRWLRKETVGRLTRNSLDSIQASGWHERAHDEEKLRGLLCTAPESFIIVHGPRGAGKTEMVDHVIKDKKHKVIIRCDELSNARSESELLTNLAKQVGYIPLFQFMNTINNMVDVAITATTGQKAGLSATFEGQLKKILDTLSIAIQQASPISDLTNTSPDAIRKRIEATLDEKTRLSEMLKPGSCVTTNSLADVTNTLSGQNRRLTKVKRHRRAVNSDDNKIECDPDEIPVVVIDGYMSREKGPHAKGLWTYLADWAAVLAENHIAHVVFLTNNVSATKPLSKSLPNMPFDHIILTDASLESALEFVYTHLDRDEFPDLIKSIQTIGGRLTDLELFVQKIKSGQKPDDAVNDILGRAVTEVRKNAFDFDNSDGRTLNWTPIQFWAVLKQLANSENVSFDELRIHPLFKNEESPFNAMEQAELITIVHKNGRPYAIRPGKPIYKAAFQNILSDIGFSAVMDIESAKHLEKEEMVKVTKWEEELKDLSNLTYMEGSWWRGQRRGPQEIDTRIKWLVQKLAESHAKIEKYEQETLRAKKAVAGIASSFSV